MLSFFMIIWGIDLFLLPACGSIPLRISFLRYHRSGFVLTALLWVFSIWRPAVQDLFSAVLFFVIIFYAIYRRKAEAFLLGPITSSGPENLQAFGAERTLSPIGRPLLLILFFGVLISWLCGMLVLSVGLSVLMSVVPSQNIFLGQAALLSVLAGVWMIALIRDMCRRAQRYCLKDFLGLASKRVSLFWAVFVPLVLGWLIALAASCVLVFRIEQPVTPFSELMDWAQPSWTFGLFIFAAVVAGPFLEEIIFRGFFFRVIQDLKGARWAFWIVAGSFGLLHIEQYWGDPAAVMIVFFIGIVLGVLRVRTGSVWSGVVMHYTFNIFMFILPGILIMASHPVFARYSLVQETLSSSEKEVLLEESIVEDNRNSMAYYELAGLYLEQGRDLDKALRLIEDALRINPGRSLFESVRGQIVYAMGNSNQALEIFEGILASNSDNRDAADHIAEIQRDMLSRQEP